MQNNRIFLFGVFLFLSYVFLGVSLLGPKLVSPGLVQTQTRNIVFVLDVSKSMNTIDIDNKFEAISRLDAGKMLIENYLGKYPDNNYGLVVFSGKSERILPFTSDVSTFVTILSGVSYKNILEGGTNIKDAIVDGIDSFYGEENGGVVVILTDGSDDVIGIQKSEFSKALQGKNIEFYVVGLGSKNGGPIPDGMDVFGNLKYVTYKGQRVISKRNDTSIRSLGNGLGGEYSLFNILDTSEFQSRIVTKGDTALSYRNENGKSLKYHFILLASLMYFLGIILLAYRPGNRK